MENDENKNNLEIPTGNEPAESVTPPAKSGADIEPQKVTQPAVPSNTHKKVAGVGNDLAIEDKAEDNGSPAAKSAIDEATHDRLIQAALNGKLTDEDKKLIDDAGEGKRFQMTLKGYQAERAENEKRIFDLAGGKDAYKEVIEWAKHNLSPEEKAKFKKQVIESGDIEMAETAVENLVNRYSKQVGKAPKIVIDAGGTASGDNAPFKSQLEVVNALRDPKYKSDPNFRAQVDKRRAKSRF